MPAYNLGLAQAWRRSVSHRNRQRMKNETDKKRVKNNSRIIVKKIIPLRF